MGRTNYFLTLISNGEWRILEGKWCYEGQRKSKALVVSESIKFDALKKKICDKMTFDSQRYDIELRYVSPMKEVYQPFDVIDDDDLEAFKFLNSKASKDGVWPIELYSSMKSREYEGCVDEMQEMECKPLKVRDAHLLQEMKVPLSAPPVTQTQPDCFSQPIRAFDKVDMTIDEILDDDIDEAPDRSRKNTSFVEFGASSKGKQVIDMVSDDEEIPKFDGQNKGIQVIDLLSDDEGLYGYNSPTNLGADSDVDKGCGVGGEAEAIVVEEGCDPTVKVSDVDEDLLREIDEEYYCTEIKSGDRAKFDDVEDDEVVHNKLAIKEGDYFNSKKELKDMVKKIALRDCFQLRTYKSDTITYDVQCFDRSCTFRCRGSRFQQTSLFKVQIYVGEHNCGLRSRHNHHKLATASMIAEEILPRFANGRAGPKAKDIVETMKAKGINASYYKANRARLQALEIVRGTAEESYDRIYSWMHMLKTANPGSHTAVERDVNQRFKYAFWTLGAWIRAMPNLRKVISVDATHLSAKYRGVLLLAAAQDGNKHIYPLAFCVADSENDASWSFFFRELKVVIPDTPEVVFVSDRHASIMRGLRNNYFLATQGYCIFHIYQNFKAKFHRGDLLDLWNKVAKAFTVQEFNRLFAQLTKESKHVSDYVEKAGFRNWARAHFPSNRFSIMTTNNAESLNSRFKEERAWPIVAMFDQILATICKWFCEHRKKANLRDAGVTEKVRKKLDSRYLRFVTMIVHRLSQFEAEVTDGTTRYEVNLQSRTCDCKVFQIDQIPCTHAIAAATNRSVDVAELVHPMLKIESFREIYKETLHPVPPVDRWVVPPSVVALTCHPPEVKRPVGRPKTNRFCAHWEKNWPKQRSCGRCGNKGHYQRSCTTPMP